MFGLSDDKTDDKPAADDFDSRIDQPEPVTYSDSHPPAPAPDDTQDSASSFWSNTSDDNDAPTDDVAKDTAVTATPEPTSLPVPSSGTNDDLLSLKQNALKDLAPLVNHLDQTPEEKFKTTMMLIQASDNASLVKDAYAAANQIQDEKSRAQALLDVVNEINYFTHQQSASDKN